MLEVGTTTEAEPEVPEAEPPKPEVRARGSKADKDKGDKGDKADDVDNERRSRPKEISKELQAVRDAENATIRDIVNALGTEGSYKIRVSRVEPEQFRDPVTKQMVPVGGFLKNYTTPVDEEVLQTNHGGGKFALQFFTRNKQQSYVFFTQRTATVVGDPRLDDTFRQVAPPGAAPPTPAATEAPGLVTKAFDIITDQLKSAREDANRPYPPQQPPSADVSPAMKQVLELMQRQLDAANQQMVELRKELADARNVKPAEDPFKERMLDNLFKDDSARLQACRMQYESEIRILKETHVADINRMRDQFDRDKADIKLMHTNETNLLRQTHEVQLQAAKGMYETNMKLAEHENRRIDRENVELKADNKELRAKKEKGPLEIIQDAEKIKEAIGAGDGEDKSGWEKAAEMAPGLIEAAKTYFQPPPQAQQQQIAGQPQQQGVPPAARIVKDAAGNRYRLDPNGTLVPVKKKPPPPPQPGPNGEPPIPEIPAEQITTIVGYLERAFSGGQEPEVVAQSGRSMVSAEILAAIRDHGVDGFLSKVAKLPGTSPLASQAGRNWVRRIGKELVGE